MPPLPIADLDSLNPAKPLYTREDIYKILPQRYEFEQLDGILYLDREKEVAAGVRNLKTDEWWCRGHMPGHPLFPGVLMLECAAQLAAFVQVKVFPMKGDFMAFGGVDGVKFRGSVEPPAQLIMLCKLVEARSRRFICDMQGFCQNQMVFEGRITGLPFLKDG